MLYFIKYANHIGRRLLNNLVSLNFYFIFLSLAFTNSQSQTLSPEATKVQQVIKGTFNAISDNDCSKLKFFCTPQLLFFENGNELNMDSLTNAIAVNRTIPGYLRTNTINYISTQVNLNTAWSSYYLVSVINSNGVRKTFSWAQTIILNKIDGFWKVAVIHSTPLQKN